MATFDVSVVYDGEGSVPDDIFGTSDIDLLRLKCIPKYEDDNLFISLDLSSAAPQTINYSSRITGPSTTLLHSIERIEFLPTSFVQVNIRGGDYSDTLIGGEGVDTLDGSAGDDVLQTSVTPSTSVGGDTLSGGPGNDTFLDVCVNNQYYYEDYFVGGGGTDRFVMPGLTPMISIMDGLSIWTDVIKDFEAGEGGDVIAWASFFRDAYYRGELQIVQVEDNTEIQLLRYEPADAPLRFGNGWVWTSLVILEGVNASDLVSSNFDKRIDLSDDQDDAFRGTNANDLFNGGFGDDSVIGGAGHDTLTGGQGNDTLDGGSGNDNLTGGYGNDRIYTVAGDDTAQGGFGDDRIDAGAGNDKIFGDDGRDLLIGGDGNDRLDGGTSNDVIYGDSGNDTLVTGSGDDILYGGEGADTFVPTMPQEYDRDFITIYSFEDGVDRIDLRQLMPIDPDGMNSYFRILDGEWGAIVIIAYGPFDVYENYYSTNITLAGVSATQISDADFIF